MEHELLPFYKKLDLNLIAAWYTLVGQEYEETWIVAYQDLMHYARVQQTLSTDSTAFHLKQRMNLFINSSQAKLMMPTKYSPLREVVEKRHLHAGKGRIYEQRIIDLVPGRRREIDEFVQGRLLPLYRRHGVNLFAIWQTLIGKEQEETWIIVYDSLAEYSRIKEALAQDPEMNEIRHERNKLVVSGHTKLLVSTRYSPVK
ncbi:MAG: NIPSNAP family protein [Candidatus Tectomicrobia bacterium]|nr:NIPSNAP family protein [Candidatus Tectomicrobia bacterium]